MFTQLCVGLSERLIVVEIFAMNHRGIEYTVTMTTVPGVWKWQFRIGDEVKTGKTETRIEMLAIRRVQLRIDRELRKVQHLRLRRST
jgi:hypothetical protein